ncbi:MAG: hypothetical protein MK108_06925 [Mariniblastus sp.]|nr:hypothetical protein [Mariniblastus sp.]
MRLVFAALIPLILFGGVAAYVEFTDRVRPEPVNLETRLDDQAWSVRLYPTAQLEGDADFDEPSLRVQFHGQPVFADSEPVAAGREIRIDPLQGVRAEQNSLFVQATFSATDSADEKSAQPAALRVQVFRGPQQRAERTFWKAEGRASISGEIKFSAPRAVTGDEPHDAGEHP